MKRFAIYFSTVMLLSVGGPSLLNHSVQIAAQQAGPPAFLADVQSWVVTSSGAHRTYQISVALPDGYTKEHPPYQVLYAMDANMEFGTVVEAARAAAFSRDIPDLVVVGIGYPNPGQGLKASNAPRTLDLTPTFDPAWIAQSADEFRQLGLPVPEASGGAGAFLGFLRDDLIPSIEQRYNVKHDDRAFFGHSFGGLFGLYALFRGNGLFDRFIIGSPSIWWNNRSILESEKSFAASSSALAAEVFLSVGLREEQEDPRYQMVGDLRRLVATFQARHYKGLTLHTQYFEDEDHLSVVPATISRGLRFIYKAPR